ncbi:MAG: branched-chain amino acid ABC transporter permease [Alphaproteobacteria bacterium]|nr:branched-chain amino acid ABC transporter permease [Alphaproteobacteria bacterium]
MRLISHPAVLLTLTAVLLACASVPFWGGTYELKVATRILCFALFVLSIDLLIGFGGMVTFGQAAFFGLGAYALFFLSPEYEAGSILVAGLGAMALGALAALLTGLVVVRTKGVYFIMVTLAFAQMGFALFHDTDIANGSDGAFVFVKPALTVAGVTLIDFESRTDLHFTVLAVVVIALAKLVVLIRSPFGEALQGVKTDDRRMRALGYNPYLIRLAAFTMAGALAGLAGFLFASIDGYVSPELLGWQLSGQGIVMAVLGGLGSLGGAVFGAASLVLLEEVLKDQSLVGGFIAEHWHIPLGLIIVGIVLAFRGGIAGALSRLGGTLGGMGGGRP